MKDKKTTGAGIREINYERMGEEESTRKIDEEEC
jgi:hypothetical protein